MAGSIRHKNGTIKRHPNLFSHPHFLNGSHMDPSAQTQTSPPNVLSGEPNFPLPSLPAPGNFTAEQLNAYCRDMRSDLFLDALLEVISTPRHFIWHRGERRQLANLLAAQMNACSDAPKFALDFLTQLSEYFRQHPELKPIYEKLFAQITIDALHRYITWAYLDARRRHKKENANVNIGGPKAGDDGDALEKEDVNTLGAHRASSRRNGEHALDDKIEDDIVHGDASDTEQDEETEGDEDDDDTGAVNYTNSIGTMDVSNVPTPPKLAITEAHVQRCLDMIRSLPSPVLIYWAMDVFRLKQILKAPYPPQLSDPASLSANTTHYGILLIRRLLDTQHEVPAIAAMRKLKLRHHFSLIDFALPLMKSHSPRLIITFAQVDDRRRIELLEIVNHQLAHVYITWKIDVVPEAMLATIPPAILDIPPIRRFRDYRFQKSMIAACHAFIQAAENAAGRFPFLRLAHQHAALRWLLARRSAQQRDEGGGSGDGSGENYDDLLKRFANEDKCVGRGDGIDAAILRRIVVKEMMDGGDEDGAARFARGWGLEGFVERLKEEPRRVKDGGAGGGREMKGNEPEIKHLATVSTPVYCIPDTVQIRWIHGAGDLSMLRETLAGTVLCGIDTEWLPVFSRDTSKKRTALMQMACQGAEKDRPVVVLLVDMVALLDGEEQGAKEEVEQILKEFFDDGGVRKLGYEFQGDQKLLGVTFPTLTARPNNFLDLRHVQVARPAPTPVAPGEAVHTMKRRAKREKAKRGAAEEGERMGGGLSGLVTWFLGARLDKKQQLSDWEKRPLREEQVVYAATDAHVLLDLHKVLQDQDHAIMAMVEYNANDGADGEDVVAEWAGAERGGWWL